METQILGKENMIRGNDDEEEKGRDLTDFDEAVFMTHGKLLYRLWTILTIQTFNLTFSWDQLGRDSRAPS